MAAAINVLIKLKVQKKGHKAQFKIVVSKQQIKANNGNNISTVNFAHQPSHSGFLIRRK